MCYEVRMCLDVQQIVGRMRLDVYEVSSVVHNRKLPSEAGVTWSGALQTIKTTF